MRIALITTTIRQPEVLRLYRRFALDVRFFVAGDRKGDDVAIRTFCESVGNTCYIGGDNHIGLRWHDSADDYKCAKIIGENSTCRRNLALLEALRWGADIIYTADDDNYPLDGAHFIHLERRLTHYDETKPLYGIFDGLCATGEWFDPGALLVPQTPHRGMPHRHRLAPFALRPVTQARVGVAAGLCLHDPDISAITRLANAPVVHDVTAIARAGVVVDPTTTWTVFNSQNTSFVRDLAPAMAMLAGVGRNEDIFASLLCQRVMRERGYVTHFGLPLVAQQRNLHDLFHDLEQELFGERHILDFTEYLDSLTFEELGSSVLDAVRAIYRLMPPWMPRQTSEAGLAFLEDVESVLWVTSL